MLKQTANSRGTAAAPADHFIGKAWIDTLVNNDKIKSNVIKVTFEPGARNNWHSHTDGQILIGTEGKGYVQKKGEPIQQILPGDVITIFADEVHWHGAAPDSIFTHLAVMPFLSDNPATDWLQPVTDNEYYTFESNPVNTEYQHEVVQSNIHRPNWATIDPATFRAAQPNMIKAFGEAVPVRHVKEMTIQNYKARLYRNTDNTKAPVILYLHGGGFVRGSLDTHHVMLSYLAYKSGVTILSLEYPLSPEYPYPAALDTLEQSVVKAIEVLKLDGLYTEKILIGGDSAAGNIVVALVNRLLKSNALKPIAQILIHPTLDATFSSNTYSIYEDGYVFTKAAATFGFAQYLGAFKDRQHAEVSPLLTPDNELKKFPYTIILQSDCDPCSDDATRFYDKLRKNGVPAFLKKYDGSIHNFALHAQHRDLSKQAMDDLAGLLAYL
jgi:acetyl esterase